METYWLVIPNNFYLGRKGLSCSLSIEYLVLFGLIPFNYRIKQCTEVTMQDLISTHHEMAHIQYYLQYAELPHLFRDAANPAFHEAVANAATLSVYNIPHLQRVGLYNNKTHDSYQVTMNFLMAMALEKVAYLPFAFMVDQWRWSVFEDGVENMNKRWWQMKLRYQGVVPPIPRTEADFDPGSKYHIIADQEYIKYFLASILEFQIFEQACVVISPESLILPPARTLAPCTKP
ncbi:unnamed protein product [Leptidea sinapis]|uniref:Angiotensin-converting enzyme n=1 Tax=Leptidea sinapis TaxID=189913 RepID=A0A5E4PTW3_9NEOP|nr:unnamed protein product [Leptidea sinapis]